MTRIKVRAIAVCFCGLLMLSLAWIFVASQKSEPGLRLPANNDLKILSVIDTPGHIVDGSAERYVISLRQSARLDPIPAIFLDAMLLLEETPLLARNAHLTETAARSSYLFADSPPAKLAPLLQQDGTTPSLYAALPAAGAEALDTDGNPLRWRLSSSMLAGLSPPRPWLVFEKEPEPPERPVKYAGSRGANTYREMAVNFAARFGLNAALVLAIIHSESNFSPAIVSSKSAMGLMQLLPSTASGEVHRFLYGRQGQIGFEDLRNPELNIRYGTAYLHILQTRYFPRVKDREVRETCVIASYNLGPNRFIRLYGPTPDLAAEVINKMTPQEFLSDLQNRLPARETRNFVEKVRRMKNYYASMQ